jgi:hypothetical protein
MTELKIRAWASQCRVFDSEYSWRFKIVRANDAADLQAFAQTCHDLVTDRDQSFTLADRIKLYRRWLASGRPCLVAAHDGRGHVLGTSVILPLTLDAFREYWLEGLDALDIGVEHLVLAADPQLIRFLLIDILACNNDFISRMPFDERHYFHGIGFRAMLYHLSLFLTNELQIEPVIFCSTYNKNLSKLLSGIGFQQRRGRGDLRAPVFCADFSQRHLLAEDALWLLDGMVKVITGYIRERSQPPAVGKP